MRIVKRLTAATTLLEGVVGKVIIVHMVRGLPNTSMRRIIKSAELTEHGDLLLRLSGRNSWCGAMENMADGREADVYISRADPQGTFEDGSIVVCGIRCRIQILPGLKGARWNRNRLVAACDRLRNEPLNGGNLWHLMHADFLTRFGARSIELSEPLLVEHACDLASNTQKRPLYLTYDRIDLVRINGRHWATASSQFGFTRGQVTDMIAVPLPGVIPDDTSYDADIISYVREHCRDYFRSSLFSMGVWGELLDPRAKTTSPFYGPARSALDMLAQTRTIEVDEARLTRHGSPYRKLQDILYGTRYWHHTGAYISAILEQVLQQTQATDSAPLAA